MKIIKVNKLRSFFSPDGNRSKKGPKKSCRISVERYSARRLPQGSIVRARAWARRINSSAQGDGIGLGMRCCHSSIKVCVPETSMSMHRCNAPAQGDVYNRVYICAAQEVTIGIIRSRLYDANAAAENAGRREEIKKVVEGAWELCLNSSHS